ncbi:uncharacterized protein LOC120670257 [Panicum virgatum]|uniref:Uncharacterized protein n=1 Tax=Panicum virgatum TaxID=38727 RepID=A0A8T0TAK9_PANVG|nr:uncharacterized protein LOC120670257 [Panicum virgatum]KAG2607327.1 hypothetical protein PVAP13_4NG239700 [Panicum virgatum]
MGSGLSSSHRGSSASLHQPPAAVPALVVAADGSLREFAPAASPVSASDVLGGAGANAAGGSFVCSSDALYFDADVPALGADELLRPGQIYFVLPAGMLGRPLSSADMAALAVRASDALAARARAARAAGTGSGCGRARRGGGFVAINKARVLPARHADADEEVNEKLNQRTLGGFETASRSPARSAKGLAAAARPPMRRALSTIMEDTV